VPLGATATRICGYPPFENREGWGSRFIVAQSMVQPARLFAVSKGGAAVLVVFKGWFRTPNLAGEFVVQVVHGRHPFEYPEDLILFSLRS
jgi:hypothetical protein